MSAPQNLRSTILFYAIRLKKYFDKILHDFLNRIRMISILSMHDRALRSPLNFAILGS